MNPQTGAAHDVACVAALQPIASSVVKVLHRLAAAAAAHQMVPCVADQQLITSFADKVVWGPAAATGAAGGQKRLCCMVHAGLFASSLIKCACLLVQRCAPCMQEHL